MKATILNISILIALSITSNCQPNSCTDSSIRVTYIFANEGATLFNNPDEPGKNFFTGEYQESFKYGIALMRTTWGDSVIFAKKLFLPAKDISNRNSFTAPNGTMICSGVWGGAVNNNPELLISRIDTNGNVLWARRLRYNPVHIYYSPDSRIIKNILVTSDAIYFTGIFNTFFGVIGKLDLNGNLLWSKHFSMNGGVASAINPIAPVYYNNAVYFLAKTGFSAASAGNVILTRLSETDGSIIESFAYKTQPDPLINGILPLQINYTNGNFSITGQAAIDQLGLSVPSNILFEATLDTQLTPKNIYLHRNIVPLNNVEIYTDFNNKGQTAFLTEDINDFRNKFFITLDSLSGPLRSRKFLIPSSIGTPYRNSVNFDNKQNIHFLYHYTLGSQLVTEYARISDFAPASTVSCFGKDTSILTKSSFNLTKEIFTWDNSISDVLVSNPVIFTEDTALVTKQLVCKIVSYCDSIHINGPDSACIGQPIRYTINKNNGCFKNMDWNIDTTVADIVAMEGDSAIILRFKKSGYINAAISGCVVRDSFFVTVVPSPAIKLLNRDSLLCPGKTIVLIASPGFTTYVWQDGSSGQSYSVNSPGFYKVSGTSYCGIPSSDSITITYPDTTLKLPSAQTICKYDTAYVLLPADVNNINWQPASNALLNKKTLRLYPTLNTSYAVTAERLANCPITETTEVLVKDCPQIVFIPNSFTPNGDGLNDRFRAMPIRPVQYFQLAVYNRYGQKLFETTDPARGWDGTFKNKQQPSGGYTYYCRYRFAGSTERSEQGYFLLIR